MKKTRCWALGAMSGTSLDGVDAAMVLTDGVEVFEFGETGYRTYAPAEREVIKASLGKAAGREIEAAAEVVEIAHVELLGRFSGAEVIGFHGQTTHHRPQERLTVQIGNGQVLAEALGTPVVWDFRSADMRLGGQGAPLAPFYHFALVKKLGIAEPVAVLNLGGVGNLTWIDPAQASPEAPGACLAFDTGPGNALIDDYCRLHLGREMDTDGELARSGNVDEAALAAMLADRFFARVPPKSLDRNDFSSWTDHVAGLSEADAIATLAAGTAGAVQLGIDHCPTRPARILVTGGGRKNPVMMELIAGLTGATVKPVEAEGLDGDMLEAQAFAYLAVRVAKGMPTTAPGTTGVAAPVGGGNIAYPNQGDRR